MRRGRSVGRGVRAVRRGILPVRRGALTDSSVGCRTQTATLSSPTSSMTSADNPENTILTRHVTSLMTHRDRIGHPSPPKLRQSRNLTVKFPVGLPLSRGPSQQPDSNSPTRRLPFPHRRSFPAASTVMIRPDDVRSGWRPWRPDSGGRCRTLAWRRSG
jgi:hypothetical protein